MRIMRLGGMGAPSVKDRCESHWCGPLSLLRVPVAFVDARDPRDVSNALRLRAKTRVILTFAPRPPIFAVVDVAALAELANACDAKLVYDCARDCPDVLVPLELGAHAVIREFGKSPERTARGTGEVIPTGETIGAVAVFRSRFAAEIAKGARDLLGTALSQGLVSDVRAAAAFQARRSADRCRTAADLAELLARQGEVSDVAFHGHSSHGQAGLAHRLHPGGLFGTAVAAFFREPGHASLALSALREPWKIGGSDGFGPSTAFLLEGGGIAFQAGDEPSDILGAAILQALDAL